MFVINRKQIYEAQIKDKKEWILIIYDISQKHYVGVPISNESRDDSIYLKTINKYAVISAVKDYNYSNIKKCIYIKGKPLKINSKEYDEILSRLKDYFLVYIKNNAKNNPEGISYSKWCKDKLDLINLNERVTNLKIGAIFWIDLGYNIGNELRKLRPGILWRSSSNKEMWTIIPLTTKHKEDEYYFHYDLEEKKLGTARIENLINASVNRIKEPYYIKNKIAKITKKDNDEIINIIKKYYVFEDSKKISQNKTKMTNAKRERSNNNNTKDKKTPQKVLT